MFLRESPVKMEFLVKEVISSTYFRFILTKTVKKLRLQAEIKQTFLYYLKVGLYHSRIHVGLHYTYSPGDYLLFLRKCGLFRYKLNFSCH
jgi:hypothetical protein